VNVGFCFAGTIVPDSWAGELRALLKSREAGGAPTQLTPEYQKGLLERAEKLGEETAVRALSRLPKNFPVVEGTMYGAVVGNRIGAMLEAVLFICAAINNNTHEISSNHWERAREKMDSYSRGVASFYEDCDEWKA